MVRVYHPFKAALGPGAALIYLHGGGFVVGSLDQFETAMRRMCEGAGVQVYAVDYKLAPEYQWPVQIEEGEFWTNQARQLQPRRAASSSRPISRNRLRSRACSTPRLANSGPSRSSCTAPHRPDGRGRPPWPSRPSSGTRCSPSRSVPVSYWRKLLAGTCAMLACGAGCFSSRRLTQRRRAACPITAQRRPGRPCW